MKKFLPFLLLGVATIFLLEGCSSGKKAMQQGDYYNSVLLSINRLRSNPTHKKSQETLREAYPLAVKVLEMEASNQMASNSPTKWKSTVVAYERINHLHDEILRAPGAMKVISNPKNMSNQLADARQKAAEESYNLGVTALMGPSREDAKRAYFHFEDANRFVPNYREVRDMLEESMFKATLKVVVEQIPVPTRYKLTGDFFQDKVEEYLRTNFRSNMFVRFYTPAEAQSENLPYVDQILRIQFDDFMIGQTNVLQREENVQKDSVEVGEVTMEDGTKRKVFGTVKAKMITYKKQVVSNGLLSMMIVDARSNAVVSTEKFNGEFIWISEWGNFQGDERALTDAQKRIAGSREVPPPDPQILFMEVTRPIYNNLTTRLSNFYRRY
jgi:hypothetical protein